MFFHYYIELYNDKKTGSCFEICIHILEFFWFFAAIGSGVSLTQWDSTHKATFTGSENGLLSFRFLSFIVTSWLLYIVLIWLIDIFSKIRAKRLLNNQKSL